MEKKHTMILLASFLVLSLLVMSTAQAQFNLPFLGLRRPDVTQIAQVMEMREEPTEDRVKVMEMREEPTEDRVREDLSIENLPMGKIFQRIHDGETFVLSYISIEYLGYDSTRNRFSIRVGDEVYYMTKTQGSKLEISGLEIIYNPVPGQKDDENYLPLIMRWRRNNQPVQYWIKQDESFGAFKNQYNDFTTVKLYGFSHEAQSDTGPRLPAAVLQAEGAGYTRFPSATEFKGIFATADGMILTTPYLRHGITTLDTNIERNPGVIMQMNSAQDAVLAKNVEVKVVSESVRFRKERVAQTGVWAGTYKHGARIHTYSKGNFQDQGRYLEDDVDGFNWGKYNIVIRFASEERRKRGQHFGFDFEGNDVFSLEVKFERSPRYFNIVAITDKTSVKTCTAACRIAGYGDCVRMVSLNIDDYIHNYGCDYELPSSASDKRTGLCMCGV